MVLLARIDQQPTPAAALDAETDADNDTSNGINNNKAEDVYDDAKNDEAIEIDKEEGAFEESGSTLVQIEVSDLSPKEDASAFLEDNYEELVFLKSTDYTKFGFNPLTR
jgi:hypothetical protein